MTILTRREQEISAHLCRGLTSKEIAEKLGISRRTVEDHRTNILKKYRVRNCVQLIRAVYHIGEEASA